jgi:hypothetical protein
MERECFVAIAHTSEALITIRPENNFTLFSTFLQRESEKSEKKREKRENRYEREEKKEKNR